jgi:hypothetical protein
MSIEAQPNLNISGAFRRTTPEAWMSLARRELARRAQCRAGVIAARTLWDQAAAGVAERCSSTLSKVSPEAASTADLPV